MIEAASLGVAVGWEDKGAIAGMDDLDAKLKGAETSAQRAGAGISSGIGGALAAMRERLMSALPSIQMVTNALETMAKGALISAGVGLAGLVAAIPTAALAFAARAFQEAAAESEAWANASSRLQDTIHGLTVQIGNQMVNAMIPFVNELTDLANQIGPRIVDWVQRLTGYLQTLVDVVRNAEFDFSAMNVELEKFGMKLQDNAGSLAWWSKVLVQARLDIQELLGEIQLLIAAYIALADAISGNISWQEFVDRFRKLQDETQRLMSTWHDLTEEVQQYDWGKAVGVSEATQSLRELNEEAEQGALRQRDSLRAIQESAAESWQTAEQTAEAWKTAFDVITLAMQSAAGELSNMSSIWADTWESLNSLTAVYADANQARVMGMLQGLKDEYVTHAVNVATLEAQKEKALAAGILKVMLQHLLKQLKTVQRPHLQAHQVR